MLKFFLTSFGIRSNDEEKKFTEEYFIKILTESDKKSYLWLIENLEDAYNSYMDNFSKEITNAS